MIEEVMNRLLTSTTYQSAEEVSRDLKAVQKFIRDRDRDFASALRQIETELNLEDGELDRFHPAHIEK